MQDATLFKIPSSKTQALIAKVCLGFNFKQKQIVTVLHLQLRFKSIW
jgi:hypothetical protein